MSLCDLSDLIFLNIAESLAWLMFYVFMTCVRQRLCRNGAVHGKIRF